MIPITVAAADAASPGHTLSPATEEAGVTEEMAAREPVSRAERKERTRQALLDAALELLVERSFDGLSLREVARAVGIVPTAFYRHFASLQDLGVALAEDSMRMLRQMLRDARRDPTSKSAAGSLDLLDRQIRSYPEQFRFIIRERHGGVAEIRRVIGTELGLFASELAIDISRAPGLADWDSEDLQIASSLLVSTMLEVAAALLEAEHSGRGRDQTLARAERQLRIVLLGMGEWHAPEAWTAES